MLKQLALTVSLRLAQISGVVLATAGTTACRVKFEEYCDEMKPCTLPDKPFCDLHGDYPASGFHGRTCIPNPFDAGGVDAPIAPDAQATSRLTIVLAGSGTGSITSAPAGIMCPPTCTYEVNRGTTVTLTPTPAAGSTFIAWSGFCESGGVCEVTVSEDTTVTAVFNASGEYLWSGQFGGPGWDEATAVALDGDRNAIVVGSINGMVDFGSGPVPCPGFCGFVAKFSADGGLLWTKTFSGVPLAVQIDPAGDVILTGWFVNFVNFGTGDVLSAGLEDAFVAKLSGADAAGIWTIALGGAANDRGRGIAAGPSGEAIVTGEFRGIATFGASVLTSAGERDGFLVWVGTDGSVGRTLRFGESGDDMGNAVDVDGFGYAVVAGAFSGSFQGLPSLGGYDGLVAKYSPEGAIMWRVGLGSSAEDRAYAVGLDPMGAALVTGFISGSADLGDGVVTGAFVAKYASSGVHVWSRGFGTGVGNGIAVDGAGNCTSTGGFGGSTDFGGGFLDGADGSVFIASYAADGSHRWSLATASAGVGEYDGDVGLAVASTVDGYTATAGAMFGTMGLGPAEYVTPSGADFDAFLAVFGP